MRSPQVFAPEGGGVLEEFETVTDTAVEVAEFPAASLAVAVRVCPPFEVAVVSHEIVYGA
jgi:hypothetical protein